jgi:DNA-binding SARP family transcriptional activator
MEFRVLGPLEVRDGTRTVPIGGPKPRALLGVLLLHANRVVPTTRLVDELWGERPPARAQKLVQGYVHALRKQLGDSVLVTQAPGYLLRLGPHALDLDDFQRMTERAREVEAEEAVELRQQALALWRGPPLADLLLEGDSRHEVGRLNDLHLVTNVERIEAELELGHHVRMVGELEALVAAHPYQEALHGQLMVALYRSGRQADALAVYRSVQKSLGDELGLTPGEELRDLEAAILRHDSRLDLRVTEPGAAPAPQRAAAVMPANELRPVTVLEAEIVGWEALDRELAAEEAQALITDCVAQMRHAAEEYGGTVRHEATEGISACFGLPQTHEDDPERAAWTALRILDVVGGYARDIAEAWGIPNFAVRVGIETGRAGDEAELAHLTRDAALVRAVAPPGGIAVGGAATPRLARRFDLKPFEGASHLIGARVPSPAPALRPLIGRERELEQLETIASDLVAGRGQVLLLLGEPGIGKTRLLAELGERLREQVTWLEGQCFSHGGLPSVPFVEALRRWLGIELRDPDVVLRTRARARLMPLFESADDEVVESLGRVLGLGGGEAGELRPSYVAWVEALAARAPVVLAIEDLHWAHPSTRELAEELLGITDQAPLLLVATLRRDPDSEGWRFRSRVLGDFSHRASEVTLEPLDPADSARMLATLLPGTFDERTREEIVSRSEGNPLYLEELLRALIDGGALGQRHRTWTTTIRPSALLPPELESLLVSRIDRLPEGARRLAQVAAAVGREFSSPMLERIRGSDVTGDLRDLLRAEIVREVRRYPELTCAFRHGLLQEAALATLTSEARRELYRRVASAFSELFDGSRAEHAERLAHYQAQAGDVAAASL